MKKLVFVSFTMLGLAGLSSEVLSMPPNSVDEQRASQSNPSSIPVTQEEFRDNIRREEGYKDDIRNLMEVFNSRIADLTSEISGLRQQVRNQNDRISSLTNQNNELQAQNNSLNQRLTDVFNSIEQRKLEEAKRANDLAEKQLAQEKAEAAARAQIEAQRRADIEAKRSNIQNRMNRLLRQRQEEEGYVNKTNRYPSTLVEQEKWHGRRGAAPGKIRQIDAELQNLRAMLSSL